MPATVLDAAGVACGDEDGGQHSQEAELERDGAKGNGVEDAALGVEVGGGHQGENGEGADDIHEGDERAGAEDGARQGAARIADFLAHGGDEFEAGEGEGDLRPEVDRVPVPRGHHVAEREVGCRAVVKIDDGGDAGEHEERHIGSHAAGILEPFADVEADDVQDHGDQKHGQRDGEQKGAVLRQSGAAAADDVGAHGGAGEQQAGKIKDGIDPVGPSGDKAVKGTEGLTRPGVEAALLGEARGELVDDEGSRDEKEERGEDPQADRRGAVVARGGDPARPEDRGDIEQQHIPKAHRLAQLRFGIECGGRGNRHRVTWWRGKNSLCIRK